jgi:hypothetical protein
MHEYAVSVLPVEHTNSIKSSSRESTASKKYVHRRYISLSFQTTPSITELLLQLFLLPNNSVRHTDHLAIKYERIL